jgi:hypothetical protein
VDRLDRERRARRAAMIGELERYARAGRFPRNRRFRGAYVPCFVDEVGTRCAVGHLLEVSGAGELATHVRRTANNARISELAESPALEAWLERNGLSVEEAARIQPGYCFALASCACSSFTAAALVTVVAVAPEQAEVQVTQVEGEGDGMSVAPGDLISLDAYGDASVGTKLVVGYRSGSWNVAAEVDAKGDADVLGCWRVEPPAISAPALTVALANEYHDCQEALGDVDSAWREHYDINSGEPCEPSRFNCAVSGPTGRPASLGGGSLALFAALLSWVLARAKRSTARRTRDARG